MLKKLMLAALVTGITFAANANAAEINDTGCCGEQSLQSVLDDITVGGDSSVDVHNDQVFNDHYWAIGASGGSIFTFIIEITGGASTQTFGVFDYSDPANYVNLFLGANTTSDQLSFSLKADGSVMLNFTDTGVNFAGNQFGFYIGNSNGPRFYSDSNLNGGADHMVAFQGTGTDTVQIGDFAPGVWGNGEFILGFEDGSDFDYQDLVVMVGSVNPVPEPGTLALLGLGLAGLGVSRRRK